MARIGIAAKNLSLGRRGGLEIYALQLVEALAEFDPDNEYVVLVDALEVSGLATEHWPENVAFRAWPTYPPHRSIPSRGVRALLRTMGVGPHSDTEESFVGKRVDGMRLDLVYYPATTIDPLSLATPCVLGFWDMQQEYYPEFFTDSDLRWRKGTYRQSVSKALHVVAPSDYTRRTLVEKYGTAESKVSVVPHGIPSAFTRASVPDQEEVQKKYGLPHNFVFFPANPWPHKNHARLMAAQRIYGERHGKPFPLVLSGRLHGHPAVATQLAVAASVADYVLDLGFVDKEDMAALYSAAGMLVFPSLFEGFGIPLLEAFACGCPIAAADATSIPEVVGDAAVLFDPLDPSGIADAIHRVLHDEDLRTRISRAGLERAKRYHWKLVVGELKKVFDVAMRAGVSRASDPVRSTAARTQ